MDVTRALPPSARAATPQAQRTPGRPRPARLAADFARPRCYRGRFPMTLTLRITIGSEPRLFPLDADSLRIGRSSQNAIQISDPTVSKAHAEIARAGERFTIRDLGSRNGTRLNGVDVH